MAQPDGGSVGKGTSITVVDDDEPFRHSLVELLQTLEFAVKEFSSAHDALGEPITTDVIISDVRMPGMSGLDFLVELKRRNVQSPVILVTGHGEIAMAISAMRNGAVDFIEKPFDVDELARAIDHALSNASSETERKKQIELAETAIKRLTQRERDVFEHLMGGSSNKIVAYELGISTRTVEIHRSHLMEKLNTKSFSVAVRMAILAGLGDSNNSGGNGQFGR
jgi:two-component system response regulator FixJ